jgi:hypothetical protein
MVVMLLLAKTTQTAPSPLSPKADGPRLTRRAVGCLPGLLANRIAPGIVVGWGTDARLSRHPIRVWCQAASASGAGNALRSQ